MASLRTSVPPRADAAAFALISAGALIALTAVFVLFVEVYEWASHSEWPGLTLADGLALFGIDHALPETESQRLADVLMATPLGIATFTIGILLVLIGANLGDAAADRRLSTELRRGSPLESLDLLLSTDLSNAQVFRLLLLDRLLRFLLLLGAGLTVLGAGLSLRGDGSWMIGSGVVLLAIANLGWLAFVRRREP